MANTYEIDYNDPKFAQIESQKEAAINDMNNTYNNMINQSDQFYQDQMNAAKDYATQQQQIQQQQTDFTIEQINQQKDKANKDYTKEQSGAYVDWQKQSNQFGAAAEQQAAQGLTNTGFSESSQVSMYNQYQNRVSTARESYNAAVLNYDNAIKDAQLQNNAALAEIAYQALQKQLEISLQGFQYKNELIMAQADKKQELDNTYYNRYLDVLNQMNTENALAEEVRQYNESLAFEKEQFSEQIRQYEQNYALEVKQYNEQIRQFNEEIARLKAKDKAEADAEAKRIELQKKQLEQQKKEADRQYKLAVKELNAKLKQIDQQIKESNANIALTKARAREAAASAKSLSTQATITKSKNDKKTAAVNEGLRALDKIKTWNTAGQSALLATIKKK